MAQKKKPQKNSRYNNLDNIKEPGGVQIPYEFLQCTKDLSHKAFCIGVSLYAYWQEEGEMEKPRRRRINYVESISKDLEEDTAEVQSCFDELIKAGVLKYHDNGTLDMLNILDFANACTITVSAITCRAGLSETL